MADEEKSSGRQGFNPSQERDVRVKGDKTSREMPSEDLRQGGVVESQSGNERTDSLENVDNDMKGGDASKRSDEDRASHQARGGSQPTGRSGDPSGGSKEQSPKPGEQQKSGSQQGQSKSKP